MSRLRWYPLAFMLFTLTACPPPPELDQSLQVAVSLEHPESGQQLTENATVAAVGTANDGVADRVPYQVLLEGIEEAQQDTAMVTVSVDGYASTPSPASAGQRVGNTGRRLSGEIPFIDVGTSQTVVIKATLHMPDGGVSEQTVSITLTADAEDSQLDAGDDDDDDGGTIIVERWYGQVTSESLVGTDTVSVEAGIQLEQTQASLGQPITHLRVTGGALFWTRSGSVGSSDDPCLYTTDPVEVPIGAGDGEILINVATGTYSMQAFTDGPEVIAAEHCGADAFVTQADSTWLPALDEGQYFVSQDGNTISGTYSVSNETWRWTFIRQ